MSSDNGEETPPLGTPTLRNEQNLPVLQVIGNYLLESKQHAIRLEHIYDSLRDMDRPVTKLWSEKLLDEFERHHEADGRNLEALRQFVKD
jgi:hypothetical protein